MSILIPESLETRVMPKLVKLARKCGVAHGVVPGVTVLAPRGHKTMRMSCKRVSVEAFPRANGWAFVARIEHTSEGNLVACAPDEAALPEWREAKPTCDHCNALRGRKETFVIRGPEGQLRRIGRNCLADFVQCDAEALIAAAAMSDFFGEADPDSWFGGGWIGETDTAWFVACALASTERHGFRKGGPTKNDAMFLAGPCPSSSYESREARREWIEGQPTEAQAARTVEVLAWAAELTDPSDYMRNLRIAARLLTATKHEGLLASLPAAFERAQGQANKARAERAERPASEWIGEVGKRAEWRVTYEGYTAIDGQYGTVRIMRFRGPAGELIVWFCSGSCERPEEGSTCLLKATVKRHDTRKNEKQTVVSRGVISPAE